MNEIIKGDKNFFMENKSLQVGKRITVAIINFYFALTFFMRTPILIGYLQKCAKP
jgi:hypothetical protein